MFKASNFYEEHEKIIWFFAGGCVALAGCAIKMTLSEKAVNEGNLTYYIGETKEKPGSKCTGFIVENKRGKYVDLTLKSNSDYSTEEMKKIGLKIVDELLNEKSEN